MTVSEYKDAAVKLHECSEYLSYIFNGLNRDKNRMYPVKAVVRLGIVIKLWK